MITCSIVANPGKKHSRIFVKNSHFVWDPARQRKLRRRLGHLVKSTKETLDEMLDEHLEYVKAILLEKKIEFEENDDVSSRTDEGPQSLAAGFRSPPLRGRSIAANQFESDLRQESATRLPRSPKLPPVGMFGVPLASPRSPLSPMKRTP